MRLLLLVFDILQFFSHIVSVETEFPVASQYVLDLILELLDLNIFGMSYGPAVLQFLTKFPNFKVFLCMLGYL